MTRMICSVAGCSRPVHARGLCGAHTMRLRRRGSLDDPPAPELRFWAFVDVHGPVAARRPDLGACWLWGGAHDRSGYPVFSIGSRAMSAAKYAWSLAWGEPAPPGLRLERFACGLAGCVNPDHLRPRAGLDSILGHRNLVAWNVTHDRCVMGHPFTHENTVIVPGGRACRACRADVARARRSPGSVAGAPA